MTRRQAFEYYEELSRTGKLEEFRTKHPDDMTRKERDLFYYDDGEVLYNPFSGVISFVSDIFPESLFGKFLSELTIEEQKILGIYE